MLSYKGRSIMRYCLLLLFMLFSAQMLAAQTPPTPAAQRPLINFAELPFISNPELSPDGTYVAAKLAVNGKQVLAIMSLFEKNAKPILLPVGENDLNWWNWVNDRWLVIGIGKVDIVEGNEFYITRVVGISADGNMIKPIAFNKAAQNADDVIWYSRDGSPRILLSLQSSIYGNTQGFWPEVYDVDVSTGKARSVVSPVIGVFNWYADANGTVRMGIGYDDSTRKSRLLYRPDAKQWTAQMAVRMRL
jgi:hypothetical protein